MAAAFHRASFSRSVPPPVLGEGEVGLLGPAGLPVGQVAIHLGHELVPRRLHDAPTKLADLALHRAPTPVPLLGQERQEGLVHGEGLPRPPKLLAEEGDPVQHGTFEGRSPGRVPRRLVGLESPRRIVVAGEGPMTIPDGTEEGEILPRPEELHHGALRFGEGLHRPDELVGHLAEEGPLLVGEGPVEQPSVEGELVLESAIESGSVGEGEGRPGPRPFHEGVVTTRRGLGKLHEEIDSPHGLLGAPGAAQLGHPPFEEKVLRQLSHGGGPLEEVARPLPLLSRKGVKSSIHQVSLLHGQGPLSTVAHETERLRPPGVAFPSPDLRRTTK